MEASNCESCLIWSIVGVKEFRCSVTPAFWIFPIKPNKIKAQSPCVKWLCIRFFMKGMTSCIHASFPIVIRDHRLFVLEHRRNLFELLLLFLQHLCLI
jgi:hypothetical protein